MGKRAREKKLAKLEMIEQEKTLIEERKKNRLTPTIRYVRKVILTLLATVLLLWVGTLVLGQIGSIIRRLTGNGS